jgi:hypothetical protein
MQIYADRCSHTLPFALMAFDWTAAPAEVFLGDWDDAALPGVDGRYADRAVNPQKQKA